MNSMQTPDPALHQLTVFEGTWTIEGTNFPVEPNGTETPVHGGDKFAWLPGHFFLVDTWQHLSDPDGHQGVSILGFDSEEKELFTRNFDNLGFERRYILENKHNTWKFIGAKERAVREFSQDGKSYVENWEMLTDDNKWVPLCMMKGRKIDE